MTRELRRRDYWNGLKSGVKWLLSPVNGGGEFARMGLSLRGPELLALREDMERHPTGQRLLADRPDLAAALTDIKALEALPHGSLGRAFREFIGRPDTVAGYTVSGLIYKDGLFDSIQMDEATRWMIDRHLFAHDLTHLVTGYGTDQSGEVLTVLFTEGWTRGLSRRWIFASPYGFGASLMSSTVGHRAWKRTILDAYDRGAAAADHCPFHSIYFEELLDRPLQEVRQLLGVPSLPEGWDTSQWLASSWIATLAAGALDLTGAKELQAVVEAGVPMRELMRSPPKVKRELRRLAREGLPLDEMQAVLGSTGPPRELPGGA